jgi:hypothetical protein
MNDNQKKNLSSFFSDIGKGTLIAGFVGVGAGKVSLVYLLFLFYLACTCLIVSHDIEGTRNDTDTK